MIFLLNDILGYFQLWPNYLIETESYVFFWKSLDTLENKLVNLTILLRFLVFCFVLSIGVKLTSVIYPSP